MEINRDDLWLFNDIVKQYRELSIQFHTIMKDAERSDANNKKMIQRFIIEQLLNFFEYIAYLVNNKLINKNIIMGYFRLLFEEIKENFGKQIFNEKRGYEEIRKLLNNLSDESKDKKEDKLSERKKKETEKKLI